MKKVYLILSYSGSIPSKVIKFYTRKEYSHISISLDKKLNKMYSFSRLYPYNFLIGGFVHEKINEGTLKRFKKTKSLVYSISVTDKQYSKVEKIIKEFEKNKNNYHYNMLGCLSVPLHIKIKRKNYFYCAEFISYLFKESNICLDLPKLIKPNDFLDIENKSFIYNGILNNYKDI